MVGRDFYKESSEMRRMITLLLSVLLGAAVLSAEVPQGTKKPAPQKPAVKPAAPRLPLQGWAIVLDPGHGGVDPGSSTMHNDQRVVEDEYVYDVSLRVR